MLEKKDEVLLIKETKVILKENIILVVTNIEFNNGEIIDISKIYILYLYLK